MVERQLDNATLPLIDRTAAPLRRRVVDALRLSIVHGRLTPGARLVERELIDMMGVSRTVLREALRQLEAEGLIDVLPNRGAVVRKLTRAEAEDLYSIRSVLEGLAARLFVQNADASLRRKLAGALDEVVKAYRSGETDAIVDSKNRFYEILLRGAGNETLYAMIDALHARVWRWRVLGLAHPHRSSARSRASMTNLRAIVDAVRKSDAEGAERITRSEVLEAAAEVMRLVGDEATLTTS
jgi:DNA-binding GntR family transcriptional regulator